jgi:hypothetical protein
VFTFWIHDELEVGDLVMAGHIVIAVQLLSCNTVLSDSTTLW